MGVRCLHDLGIAHRDLSLENVMLADDGNGLQVKIIDFGMAALARTACQELRGKRSYQAPEMHGCAAYDTFLVDNFAVGVIIYSLAVHYYPWEYTKPEKDRSCEYARKNGIEKLLQKKKMPCNKMPVSEALSRSLVDLICGLLAFAPAMRSSLGEECFEPSPIHAIEKLDSISDVSTTESLETNAHEPEEAFETGTQSNLNVVVDNVDVHTWQARASIWTNAWFAQDILADCDYFSDCKVPKYQVCE